MIPTPAAVAHSTPHTTKVAPIRRVTARLRAVSSSWGGVLQIADLIAGSRSSREVQSTTGSGWFVAATAELSLAAVRIAG